MMNDDTDFEEMLIQNDTTVIAPPALVNTASDIQEARQISNTNTDKSLPRTNSVVAAAPNVAGDNGLRQGVNSEIVRSSAGSPMPGCSKNYEESPLIPVLGTKVKVSSHRHNVA